MNFNVIKEFEKEVAQFFGAPFAVALDCCTHGLELCLRYNKDKVISVPHRTYISIPFLAHKLGIDLVWKDVDWVDYYHITNEIIDAATYWKKDGYIPGTYMCISFQFKKHLSLGRGGIILTDNEDAVLELKKLAYDGRHPDIPWREQDIETIGYHYYMTPETASLGLEKLPEAIKRKAVQWKLTEWPDLTKMKVFNGSSLTKTEQYCLDNDIDPYLQTR